MYSCKRQCHVLENSEGLADYRLQIHSAKRHCKDKSYSPTKYAIQMERREVTHDVTNEMDCEPYGLNPSFQNYPSIQQHQLNQNSHQSAFMENPCNNNRVPTTNLDHCSLMNNNNNNTIADRYDNTIADRYVTPSDVCVRCQAGEAGHYGHIGR